MLTLMLAAALAQSPNALDELEGLDLSSLMQLSSSLPESPVTPDTRYVTSTTVMKRWPDGAETSASLDAGDRVEIVTQRGGLVRVRSGTDFGWVSPATLSEKPVDILVDQP